MSGLMPYFLIASATFVAGMVPSSARACRGSQHDEVTVDLEMLAQLVAEVGTAETVGAQHRIAATGRDVRTDLVGKQLHVVGGRDDRTAGRC